MTTLAKLMLFLAGMNLSSAIHNALTGHYDIAIVQAAVFAYLLLISWSYSK